MHVCLRAPAHCNSIASTHIQYFEDVMPGHRHTHRRLCLYIYIYNIYIYIYIHMHIHAHRIYPIQWNPVFYCSSRSSRRSSRCSNYRWRVLETEGYPLSDEDPVGCLLGPEKQCRA